MLNVAFFTFFDDYLSHISQNLQLNDNHKQFLVFIGQYVLDERPSRANEHNRDK